MQTLQAHAGPVFAVQMDAARVISGAGDRTIRVHTMT